MSIKATTQLLTALKKARRTLFFNKNRAIISYGLFCVLAAVSSCAVLDPDTEQPNAVWPSFFTANDTLLLLSGDTLSLYAHFEDNQFLKEYTLQIDPESGSTTEPAITIDTVISKPLTGQSFDLRLSWPTDSEVRSGLHQITWTCTDAVEQVSDQIHKVIRVQNSSDLQKPTLSLINPPTTPATIFGGSNLLLVASFVDNNQLGSVIVQLYNAVNNQKLYQITPVSLLGHTQYAFNTLIPIPDAEGQYKILIHLTDAVNNTTDYWLTLNVL